jgi:hypothetical protein
MRLARFALLLSCLLPVGCVTTAHTSAVVSSPTPLYYYGGPHYYPASIGGYWCGIQEPHAHDFGPDHPEFYSYENHYYYYVGAPDRPYIVGQPPANVHVKNARADEPHGARRIPEGAPPAPHTTGRPQPTRVDHPAPATATPAPHPTQPPHGPPHTPPGHAGHPDPKAVHPVPPPPPPRPHHDPHGEPGADPHSRDPNDARRLIPPPGANNGRPPVPPPHQPDPPKQPPPSKTPPPPPPKQPPPPKRDPQDIKRTTDANGKPGTPVVPTAPKALPKPPHPRPIETR